MPRWWRQVGGTLAVLGGTALGAWWLVQNPARPEEHPAPVLLPRVWVRTVEPQTVRVEVHSQGRVAARAEVDLVPQVAGVVVTAHPALANAGSFQRGEVLIQLDPRDYDTALAEAKAQLAEARKQALRETAEAEQAERDWRVLGRGRLASPYVLHQPQQAAAKAQVELAEARLRQAELNRERATLRAPFTGRAYPGVGPSVGQYLAAGGAVARLYPSDQVQVRLPLRDSELAFLDLPLRVGETRPTLPLTLSANFAGSRFSWPGRILGLEGGLDPKTHLVQVLAEADQPTTRQPPPLLLGLFVEATIPGKAFDRVAVLPPAAVRADDVVWVVAADGRLQRRGVTILRQEQDRVLIQRGLDAGERVLVSPLDNPVEGMQVEVVS